MNYCKHCKLPLDRCGCMWTPTEELPAFERLLEVRERSYTYDDMLAAWTAGKENERKYGLGAGDAPDFMTWTKSHCKF